MARQQRGSRNNGAGTSSSGGRSGGRRGGNDSSSAPFSSAAYSSSAKSRRTARSSNTKPTGPQGLHDVYDFAQASTSASSKQGKGARRALAGMSAGDYADLPSKAKGKQRRRRADDDDDDDDDDEDSDDSDAAPIGPKVFDSDDELNAGIEGSDEELDSDEAFGESDEEKFDGWTFGRGAKSSKRKSGDSEDEDEDEEDDEDGEDGGMVDLSHMLDSASGSSDDDDDEDDEDDEEASDDENDQSSSKLAKHIESFAAGSKRGAATHSDSEAGSDAEPSSKRSRRVLSERTEAVPETEFAAAHTGSTLRLEDFMNPLSSNVDFADVRKNTKLLANPKSSSSTNAPAASKKGGGALSAPLPSVVQDRLDRQGAYSITRDEVQGWQPTINRLRDAEHLSFPLQAPAATKASTSGLVATFTPDNDMESSIAAMLSEGGLTEKQLAQQEDLAMNKLDPEEARARRDELRRMRMLMFRAEQKAKRVSKIKSKAYRKIHRKEKERLKEQMKELGSDAEDVDSDAEMEDRLKAERDRARERATLKHKNTSKWAKNILASRHGEHTQEARNELEAQLRRGAELRSKIAGRDLGDASSDDYSSDAGDDDDEGRERVVGDAFDELSALEAKEEAKRQRDEAEFERVGGKKGVYNMKFMKDARERQYAQIRGDVDDFVSEMQALQPADDASDEDAGEVISSARKGAEDAGSSTYVQGNKGRAMYGATSTAQSPVKKPSTPENSDAPTSTKSKSKSGSTAGAPAAAVEIGGSATIAKPSTERKTKPSLSSTTADDDDAANPWLMIDSTGHSQLSRKNNASVLSSHSASAAAASRSAVRAAKASSKSSSSVRARRDDEHISIDVNSRLSHADPSSSDEDDQPRPVSTTRRGHLTPLQQRSLVASAFAGDDVVSEFAAEKAATVEADESKTIDTRLPGWGSWTGKGTRPSTRPANPKFMHKIQGVDKDKRKDAGMAHVIISERRDKKQDKYTRKDLPYPYTSLAQYKAAMQQPLGKEWNTRIETQRLNLPRVTKKPGKVITPVVRKF